MYACVGDRIKEPKKEPMSPEVKMKPEQWLYGEAEEIVPAENMSPAELVQKYKQVCDKYEHLRTQMVQLFRNRSESTQDVKTTGMVLIMF